MLIIQPSGYPAWPYEIPWPHVPGLNSFSLDFRLSLYCQDLLGPENQSWRATNSGVHFRNMDDALMIKLGFSLD